MHRFKVWHRSQGSKLVSYLTVAVLSLLLVILGQWRSPALAVTPRHYTELTFEPLPEVQIPDYTQFELSNGMTVYLVEDHELPLVGGTAMIRTGNRFEPSNQTGLASITGDVIRSGGTQAHPPALLNQILEDRAASIETGIDTASGSASFSALSEDLEEVFTLFAEVLRSPAFPQERIDFTKNQWRGSIARRNDDPDSIVGREFQKLLYGADSPYARTVEYATLNNISRDDVVNFYNTYVQPKNILLGVVGDFETAQMRSLIERTFSDWQPDRTQQADHQMDLPRVNQAQTGGIFLVDQPQLTQSYVQIGHLGGRLDDPDYAALSVMNEVMNGFGGRLVNEVRSRQGLAYSVYAFWSPRFDYPGVFIAGGQTRSDATTPFIQSVVAEIDRIRKTPISQVELQRAKDSVLNAFVFNFQSPSQTLSRVMRYNYYDYPQDFIFRYQREVQAVTVADVQRAAQTHLKPDNLVTLVVGNAAAVQPSLNALAPQGTVTPIDVTIPQPVQPAT